ncbi:hypothetical protein CR513_07062, partial [Mucuna pruriens]
MCFVLSCWTGLWAILIAELLSQNNFIGPSYFTLRSSRIIFIHNPSHIPCAMARNSASALDRATTFCFLLLQDNEYILPLGDKDTLFGICNLNWNMQPQSQGSISASLTPSFQIVLPAFLSD